MVCHPEFHNQPRCAEQAKGKRKSKSTMHGFCLINRLSTHKEEGGKKPKKRETQNRKPK
jgi:hypothetical protein